MRLVSWNVNGLRAVHRKGLFLDWVAQDQPDILCIQETKAAEDQLPFELRPVNGYHAYFSSHTTRKGYSGVGVYAKRPPLDVRRGFGVAEFDDEGRTLVLNYGDFVLLGVYFPNGKSSAARLDYKMRFYDAFLSYVDGLRAQGREVIFCGDVNTAHTEIDLARPKENEQISGFLPIEREWLDRVTAHGFVDTFRHLHPGQRDHYSYWDMISRARERNVGWRIDYFFVSEGLMERVADAFILPDVMGSDHCPVGIDLSF